jgi:hypothetical protein
MARAEPCIQHALVALGYLTKTEPGSLKHAHARLIQQDRTLNLHYSRAVGLLVERLAEQSCNVEVGLVACLLFVCIEFIRGNFMTAFTHLHSGLRILSEMPTIATHGMWLYDDSFTELTAYPLGLRPRTQPPISPKTDTIKIPASNSLLNETLIPMFMRNITPAMLFGAPIEDLFEIPIPDRSTYDVPFSTFYELQMSSFQLRNASALFARSTGTKIFVKAPLTPEDFARQAQLLDAHHAWLRALQKLEQAQFLTHEEEIMAAALKLGYYSTYIMIDCAMSLGQSNYDAHLDYFKAINHNARIVLDSMGIATPPLPMSSGTRRGLSRKHATALKAAGSKNSSRPGESIIDGRPEEKY